jgi:RNA polymerase sigma-70 factor (ECF subfamily)
MTGDEELERWFKLAVLPLEPGLVHFVRRNWRNESEVIDIRQEVYERCLRGAQKRIPDATRSYVMAIARNVLIDRARRAKVVSIEFVADLEAAPVQADLAATDRRMDARDELRRVMKGLESLPPRCREVVRLRKMEGLTVLETAARMGVSHHTIERQLTLGIRAITDFMLGGEGRIDRSAERVAKKRSRK